MFICEHMCEFEMKWNHYWWLKFEIYGKCQAVKWHFEQTEAEWRVMSVKYDTIKATMASRRKNQLWYIVVGLLAFCVSTINAHRKIFAIWPYFMSLRSDRYWFRYVNDAIRCCFLWQFHHLCASHVFYEKYFRILFCSESQTFICFTFNFVPILKISSYKKISKFINLHEIFFFFFIVIAISFELNPNINPIFIPKLFRTYFLCVWRWMCCAVYLFLAEEKSPI